MYCAHASWRRGRVVSAVTVYIKPTQRPTMTISPAQPATPPRLASNGRGAAPGKSPGVNVRVGSLLFPLPVGVGSVRLMLILVLLGSRKVWVHPTPDSDADSILVLLLVELQTQPQ
jgi:hypothetical protein